MIVKREREVSCKTCRKVHTIHEYIGLEGAWYTSHICLKEVRLRKRKK